jgi:hypothetical protein
LPVCENRDALPRRNSARRDFGGKNPRITFDQAATVVNLPITNLSARCNSRNGDLVDSIIHWHDLYETSHKSGK